MATSGETGPGPTAADLVPAEVPRVGTNVLLAGPTPAVLGDLPRRVLSTRTSDGEAVVAASTRREAPVVERSLAAADLSGPVGTIDCTPTHDVAPDDPRRLRWSVRSPTDLTGTSIAVEKCVDRLAVADPDAVHLFYDSLSTTVNALDTETVVRFVDHAGRSLASGVAFYVAYTSVLDRRQLACLRTAMDAAIDVRKRDDRREVRCRRVRGAPDGWTPLAPADAARNAALSD